MRTVTLPEADIYKGSLLLVNASNPIKSDGFVRLTALDENGDIFLETKAAALLRQLFETLGCTGSIVPVSGYRSKNEQQLIYLNSLRSNGKVFTNKYVALPDCSEHQTGLAIDLAEAAETIDFLCPAFPYEGICGEFRKLAARYGFIERYVKDKEHLTGFSPEPWHFRYTGYPHSLIMREYKLCLEEYAAFLKSYPYKGTHLYFGQTEVFFTDADTASKGLLLPEDCTQISGNNTDGFIVTVWRASI